MSACAVYKVILLGESNVGKTSLMVQYVNKKFAENYKATLGVDILSKTVALETTHLKLNIWDTCGQERFSSFMPQFYRDANACVFVFDLTARASLVQLHTWYQELFTACQVSDIAEFPMMLLGNKADLPAQGAVSHEEIGAWCRAHHNMPYFEVSAKCNVNVDGAFRTLAQTIIKHHILEDEVHQLNFFPENFIMEDTSLQDARKPLCC